MRNFTLFVVVLFSFSSQAEKNTISRCNFENLFHKLATRVNTTTLRKELKIVVNETQANWFIEEVEKILGDDKQQDPAKKRMSFREKPDSPNEIYFTQTEYLPKFQGVDKNQEETFNAVIRIRKYIVAPKDATSNQVANDPHPRLQQMTDSPGEYAKL